MEFLGIIAGFQFGLFVFLVCFDSTDFSSCFFCDDIYSPLAWIFEGSKISITFVHLFLNKFQSLLYFCLFLQLWSFFKGYFILVIVAFLAYQNSGEGCWCCMKLCPHPLQCGTTTQTGNIWSVKLNIASLLLREPSIFAESLVLFKSGANPATRPRMLLRLCKSQETCFFLLFFYERGVSYRKETGAFFPSFPLAPPPAAAVA